MMTKNPPANAGDIRDADPLEEGMATLFSILAWRIPWTEEPGGPQGRKEEAMTEVIQHLVTSQCCVRFYCTAT